MKETTLAFVTFFMSIVVIAQIKLISRLVKMRRERRNIQGILYTYRSPCTACCFGCECCLECLWGERIRRKKETEYEKSVEEQKIKELKEFEEKKELSEKEEVITEKEYITEEEVIDRIKDLADDKEKTNLQWLSTVTAIPIERIVKTLANDSNFMVEGEYVINKKMLVKEEKMGIRERIERAQLKEMKMKKLKKNICPDCNNSFKPDTKHCESCGVELKR